MLTEQRTDRQIDIIHHKLELLCNQAKNRLTIQKLEVPHCQIHCIIHLYKVRYEVREVHPSLGFLQWMFPNISD